MSHGARIESTIIPDHILRRMNPEDRPKGVEGMTKEQLAERHEAKSEKELQEQISGYLRIRGIWFERKSMHKKSTGTTGCPDFLFAVNGHPVAFEVKTRTGRTSDAQESAIEQMITNGWNVYTIRSFGDAVDVLNKWIKK